MFFGLFGKGAKNSLEEMKENLETVKNLMDSNKKDKILLEGNIFLNSKNFKAPLIK
jgi:hypothetical protein